jgi:GTP cyclohydrolase I
MLRGTWEPAMKKRTVNQKKIRDAVRSILEAIGEDPNRDGLLETPDRVARM